VIEAVLARSAAREPPSPIPPPDFIPGHSLPEDWVNGRLCGEPQKLWTMR
jgi:hypothetical protein